MDSEEKTNVRTAAYRASIECASPAQISTLLDAVMGDDNKQGAVVFYPFLVLFLSAKRVLT